MPSCQRRRSAKLRLDQIIRKSAPRHDRARSSFWRLITAVRSSSRMLRPTADGARFLPDTVEEILLACTHLAEHCAHWRREPESWDAPVGSSSIQLRSLIRHLLDRFPVPTFMAAVWCRQICIPWEIEMYLHLAAGRGIRQFEWPFDPPIGMTKTAAQWFMKSPDHIPPICAYRWAQVRSLGGGRCLADALVMNETLLAPTEHEAFWETVIRFLIEYSPLNNTEIDAIVEFVDQQRFQPAETVWGPGAGTEPLRPDFSIKGRTLMSLRRCMANWRTEMLATHPLPAMAPQWRRTPIAPFHEVCEGTTWTIDELLSDKELRIEGGVMRHCIATYIHDCARRKTSVWSMKKYQDNKRVRTLTIEVLPLSRTIWQAKGKRNASPEGMAKKMLQRWADKENLTIGNFP